MKVAIQSNVKRLVYENKGIGAWLKKSIGFSLLLIIITYNSFSQTSLDLGIWGGSSTYSGDLVNVQHLDNLKPNYGVFARYNFNPRVALRIMFLNGKLQKNGTLNGTGWAFTKNVQDVSIQAEINYLKYLFGVNSTKYSPYVTGGIGVNFFPYTLKSASDELNSGADSLLVINKINPLFLSDGTAVTFTEIDKNVIAMNVSFGMGIKFNIGKKMAVGVEYQMRKVLSDKLDNLDDPLAHTKIIDGEKETIIYSGWLHNNDWLGYLGVHLTYKINLDRKSCPAYDRKYW